MKNLAVFLLTFLPHFLFAQSTPNLWTEYAANQNAHSNIPNCSYAGYHNGDIALPTGSSTMLNIKSAPYNAVGNGVADDTEAIKLALKAAKDAGGGIVYLPDGTYQCSQVLFIHGSNVILRGQSKTGTKIRFTKSLTTGYAENFSVTTTNALDQRMWSWCGGMIWITPETKNTYLTTDPTVNINASWLGINSDKVYMAEKELWNVKEQLTLIQSNENRGSFSFTVADASKLTPNLFISIRYANPANWSLQKFIVGDGAFAASYPWGTGTDWISPTKRPYIDWVTQIESVNGNVITLKQPLRMPLRSEWECKIMGLGDLIQESGVENLNVELEKDYASDYANGNWRNANHNREKGWNGIYLNNATNCFIKNVTIYDAETSVGISASKNITVTGVSALGKDQAKSVHHGFNCRVQSQDILFENFELNGYGQFDHGISIEDYSMGSAWHNGLVVNGCFDTHKLMPAECIRTNIKVQVAGGNGGAGEAGPQIGGRFVHWNVEVKGTNNSTIVPATTLPKGALVGIINAFATSSTSSECLVEANGLSISPSDLYIAQKKNRNNIVQPDSYLTPWTTYTLPTRIEAENSKFLNVPIDGDSQDPLDSSPTKYLHSFLNITSRGEYDIDFPDNGIYPISFRLSGDAGISNTLAIMSLQGDTLNTVSFIGTGRGKWESYNISIPFNKGKQAILLGWKNGSPCLNWFEIKLPTTTFPIATPIFISKTGKYNARVNVQFAVESGAEIRYTTDGYEPNLNSAIFNNVTGLTLTQTTTIKAIAIKSNQVSNIAIGLFEIIPAPTVPCLIVANQYSDAYGVVVSGSQATYNDPGTWSEYIVNANEAGNYVLYENVSIKLRAPVTSVGFDIEVNGVLAKRFEKLPDMGGNWDRFGAYPVNVQLNKGLNVIRHTATTPRCNLAYLELVKDVPTNVPGTIQAEYYVPPADVIGLIYTNNTGSGKNPGREVDVKTTIHYLYPVKVSVTGVYPVTIFTASRAIVAVDIIINGTGQVVGSYSIPTPATSSDIPILINSDFQLPKGEYLLELKVKSGDHRLDKIVIGNPTSTNPNDPGITSVELVKQTTTIFPNPAKSFVKVTQQGINKVRIFSVDGITLYNSEFTDQTIINVANFKSGIYLLQVNEEKSNLLIINHN